MLGDPAKDPPLCYPVECEPGMVSPPSRIVSPFSLDVVRGSVFDFLVFSPCIWTGAIYLFNNHLFFLRSFSPHVCITLPPKEDLEGPLSSLQIYNPLPLDHNLTELARAFLARGGLSFRTNVFLDCFRSSSRSLPFGEIGFLFPLRSRPTIFLCSRPFPGTRFEARAVSQVQASLTPPGGVLLQSSSPLP